MRAVAFVSAAFVSVRAWRGGQAGMARRGAMPATRRPEDVRGGVRERRRVSTRAGREAVEPALLSVVRCLEAHEAAVPQWPLHWY